MAVLAPSRSSGARSVLSQINRFEREVDAACRRILRSWARRIRKVLIEKRLSNTVDPLNPGRSKRKRLEWNAANPGAPLAKRSRNLIKHLRFDVVKTEMGWTLDCQSLAPYSDLYEEKGRFKFKETCDAELVKAQEEIELALQVIARGQTSGLGRSDVALPTFEESGARLGLSFGEALGLRENRRARLEASRIRSQARRDRIKAERRRPGGVLP